MKKTMTRSLAAWVCVLALMLALAGCGGTAASLCPMEKTEQST